MWHGTVVMVDRLVCSWYCSWRPSCCWPLCWALTKLCRASQPPCLTALHCAHRGYARVSCRRLFSRAMRPISAASRRICRLLLVFTQISYCSNSLICKLKIAPLSENLTAWHIWKNLNPFTGSTVDPEYHLLWSYSQGINHQSRTVPSSTQNQTDCSAKAGDKFGNLRW
jgi:hypothetical protein